MEEENECLICFENKENDPLIKLKNQELFFKTCLCDVYIHETCLETWHDANNNCPICRQIMIRFENKELEHYLYIIHFLFLIRNNTYIVIKNIKNLIFIFVIGVNIINILMLTLKYIESKTQYESENISFELI